MKEQFRLSIFQERAISLLVRFKSFSEIRRELKVTNKELEQWFEEDTFVSCLEKEAEKRGCRWRMGALEKVNEWSMDFLDS